MSLLALGVLFAVAIVNPSWALHKETPQGTRLTSGADHTHSTGRSWGSYYAYVSPVDLTGGGAVGRVRNGSQGDERDAGGDDVLFHVEGSVVNRVAW